MRTEVLVSVLAFLILSPFTCLFSESAEATLGDTPVDRPLEGFGADTPGGSGGTPYVVTSLENSGPGTLRDALSGSNRHITFAVAGEIRVNSTINATGHHITIDGASAPPPGITICPAHSGVSSALLELQGHDVIMQHIRICDAPDSSTGDNLRIRYGHNIVIDHCSFRRGGDGNFDISNNVHDVTVQWCILAATVKNNLLRSEVSNISLHHNLYVSGNERNPQLQNAYVVDMVNNVIYNWASNYGTRIRYGASANIVKNCYIPGSRSDKTDAVVISGDAGPVYMADNMIPSQNGDSGTTFTRLPAPPVTEMPAEDALGAVLAEAGAFPRDADDRRYVDDVATTAVRDTSWGKIKAMYR